jgi:hypothetical protein
MTLGQDTQDVDSEQLNVPHAGPSPQRASVLFLTSVDFFHWSKLSARPHLRAPSFHSLGVLTHTAKFPTQRVIYHRMNA